MISIDIEVLKREYLFASTAAHLYEHFREDGSLRRLAQEEKPEILVKEYKERTVKGDRSVEDVVVAYAVLIAVTFYDYKEAIETFNRFDLSKLEWGEKVKDIYMQEAQITTYITGQGKGKEFKDIFTRAEERTKYITEHGRGIIGDFRQVRSDNSGKVSDTPICINRSN